MYVPPIMFESVPEEFSTSLRHAGYSVKICRRTVLKAKVNLLKSLSSSSIFLLLKLLGAGEKCSQERCPNCGANYFKRSEWGLLVHFQNKMPDFLQKHSLNNKAWRATHLVMDLLSRRLQHASALLPLHFPLSLATGKGPEPGGGRGLLGIGRQLLYRKPGSSEKLDAEQNP